MYPYSYKKNYNKILTLMRCVVVDLNIVRGVVVVLLLLGAVYLSIYLLSSLFDGPSQEGVGDEEVADGHHSQHPQVKVEAVGVHIELLQEDPAVEVDRILDLVALGAEADAEVVEFVDQQHLEAVVEEGEPLEPLDEGRHALLV